jgi:hypothetical protein
MKVAQVRCHKEAGTSPVAEGECYPAGVVVEVVKVDRGPHIALPGRRRRALGLVHFSGVGRQRVRGQKLGPERKLV